MKNRTKKKPKKTTAAPRLYAYACVSVPEPQPLIAAFGIFTPQQNGFLQPKQKMQRKLITVVTQASERRRLGSRFCSIMALTRSVLGILPQ